MGLAEYRQGRALTQEAAAAELGLTSKGYFSSLERGRAIWPLRLALQVEVWSSGAVKAVDLLDPDDAELLAGVIKRAHAGAGA